MNKTLEKTENCSKLNDGWSVCKLEECFKLTSGEGKPDDFEEIYSENKKIPVYGGNGICGYSNKASKTGENIIIGRVGENCGCIHYINEPCCITDNALYTKEFKKQLSVKFISYALEQIDLRKLRNKGGQPLVSQKPIYNTDILLPPLPEQQKIAEVLSCWDKAIEKTESLISAKTQLKKALMQKLLTGKVRFGEFACQKWKKVKFEDVFSRITRKNTENNTNILTISAQQGLINQEEFYKKRIASKDTSNYILIKNGEFAYNKSYSTGYPMGAIKKLDKYESGVVSSLYICFETKTKDVCSLFFAHYFEAGMLNQEIQNIAQEGARNHGLLNIGITEFFNTMLKIPPSLEEQQKIAGVLDTCDKEIELLNKQLDALKEQKKGLMQKLLTGQIRVKTA